MAEGITYGMESIDDANGTMARFDSEHSVRQPIRIGDLVAELLKLEQSAILHQQNAPVHYLKLVTRRKLRPAVPGEAAYVEGAQNQVIDEDEPYDRVRMGFW